MIHQATLLGLNNSHPKTGQVKGSDGQDQEQALECFGGRELAAVDLIATGFFVAKTFFMDKIKLLNFESSGVLAGETGLEPATGREPEPDLHLSMHPALQKPLIKVSFLYPFPMSPALPGAFEYYGYSVTMHLSMFRRSPGYTFVLVRV